MAETALTPFAVPNFGQVSDLVDDLSVNVAWNQAYHRASAADKQIKASLLDSERMLSESEINLGNHSISKANPDVPPTQPSVDPKPKGTVVAPRGQFSGNEVIENGPWCWTT
ncbi:MAG: hypothetical protein HOM55_09915 [Proteobacteria bacterium]|nr:hypothetical protein [Pseudomonadota bacterium]